MTAAPPQRAPVQSSAAPSPFPPIAYYAFLSNCHTGALVAPDGAIDWLCVPRFDSPSVFGTLLDREAGTFRLGPFGINVPAARVYVPGTNVLETTWKTPTGWVVVRDALTMGPRRGVDTVTPHTRPPTDDDAEHLLVRTAVCIEGTVELELVCEPVFDYGRETAEWALADIHTADASGAGQTIRLRTDLALGIEVGRVRARHTLREGEATFCSLSWAGGLASPEDAGDATARLDATARFWRSWVGRARIPDQRWRQPILRSALAIKGLTYMPTGATVAALTTSLPETPGGERNWDYRYTWMRDTTFTLQALHWLNLDWEADEFMQFVADVEANQDGALRRSCTGSTGAAIWRSPRATTCPGTPARGPSASATAPSTSVRTTSSARCSTRCCCTRVAASGCRGGCGRSSRARPSARCASGASPTRGSGRRAASRSTTSPRS